MPPSASSDDLPGLFLPRLLLQGADAGVDEFRPETTVPADGAGAGAGATGRTEGQGGSSLMLWLPLIIIFAIFYFLILRPEGKKRRAREAKVNTLKKGDKVITNGGMYGEVIKVGDVDVTLGVDKKKEVQIRFAKTAVLDVLTDVPAVAEEKKSN